MIAANIGQTIIGWAGAIPLIFIFADWRWNGTRSTTALKRALLVLIPCWILYAIAGGIGALAG